MSSSPQMPFVCLWRAPLTGEHKQNNTQLVTVTTSPLPSPVAPSFKLDVQRERCNRENEAIEEMRTFPATKLLLCPPPPSILDKPGGKWRMLHMHWMLSKAALRQLMGAFSISEFNTNLHVRVSEVGSGAGLTRCSDMVASHNQFPKTA